MTNDKLLTLLEEAYYDELESIMNYLAIAQNLETDLGHTVAEEFMVDVDEELMHAKRLSARMNVLGKHVNGSFGFEATQDALQPSEDHGDVLSAIEGSIEAEQQAQDLYEDIIHEAQEVDDHVTEDLAIELLGDEQEHEREMKDLKAELE